MIAVLAAPMFLLALTVLPGPISRLLGAKLAAALLLTTGVVVLPIAIGLTWPTVLMCASDGIVLLAGAALARRLGLAGRVPKIWLKRIAIVFSGFLFAAFGVLALMLVALTRVTADALPLVIGMLMSGVVFAVLLPRRHQHVPTFSRGGSLVSASPQA